MGHERIGFLPRTKQWKSIIDQLSMYNGDEESVFKIADDTLKAVRKSYEAMPYDESIIKAVSYLATLVFSAKQENQSAFLNDNGYMVDSQLTLFSLMASAQRYITTDTDSLEINKMAKDAALQAVINYQQAHQTEQLNLFSDRPESVWESAKDGAAFCELARTFFASFTDRHIKYYIERAAASKISNYTALQSFTETLSTQSQEIADHTFEISKIMQSFAAGWYNKNAATALPDESKVRGFLQMSFGKMREEFRREAEGK